MPPPIRRPQGPLPTGFMPQPTMPMETPPPALRAPQPQVMGGDPLNPMAARDRPRGPLAPLPQRAPRPEQPRAAYQPPQRPGAPQALPPAPQGPSRSIPVPGQPSWATASAAPRTAEAASRASGFAEGGFGWQSDSRVPLAPSQAPSVYAGYIPVVGGPVTPQRHIGQASLTGGEIRPGNTPVRGAGGTYEDRLREAMGPFAGPTGLPAEGASGAGLRFSEPVRRREQAPAGVTPMGSAPTSTSTDASRQGYTDAGDPYVGWDKHGPGRPPREGETFNNPDNSINWVFRGGNWVQTSWRDSDSLTRFATGNQGDALGAYAELDTVNESDLEDAGWRKLDGHEVDGKPTWVDPEGKHWSMDGNSLTRVDARKGYNPETGDPYVGWDKHGPGRPPREGETFKSPDNGIDWVFEGGNWVQAGAAKDPRDESTKNAAAFEARYREAMAAERARIEGSYKAEQLDPRYMEQVLGAQRQRIAAGTARAQRGAMLAAGRTGVDAGVASMMPAELYQNQVVQGAEADSTTRLQFEMQNLQARQAMSQQKLAALSQLASQSLDLETKLWASQEAERVRQEGVDMQLALQRMGAEQAAAAQAAQSSAQTWQTVGSLAGGVLGMIGGPIGSMIGSSIGGAAGGAIGGAVGYGTPYNRVGNVTSYIQ